LDEIYIFDTDSETFDQRKGGGTQLIPFRYYLSKSWDEYKGNMEIKVRKLVIPQNIKLPLENLEEYAFQEKGKSFEFRKANLVKSFLGVHTDEDLSRLFCSELTISCYRQLGLLPQDMNASNYLPKDFEESDEKAPFHIRHLFEQNLFPLLQNAYLDVGIEFIPDFPDLIDFNTNG